MLYRLLSFALLFTLLGTISVYGQQITANDSTGCAPMTVTFTGVPGATNVVWNFGNSTSSGSANPQSIYTQPGSYTVTYSATVNGSPFNSTIPITVHGKPTPAFSAISDTKGCIPLPVTFNSTSTGGGGSAIVNHVWAFGDGGGASNTGQPTHTYTLAGQFSVTLIVTDANGCDSSTTVPNIATASAKPVPVITSSPTSSCTAPLTVTFNGSQSTSGSPVGNTLTYGWSFGNGNTASTVGTHTQTYTTPGTYTVKLIVTDNNFCSDSTTTTVTIADPLATFFVPDTVCKTVTFDPTGSSSSNLVWQYGDGQVGSSTSHTYAVAGVYTVSLTVLSTGCQDDTTRTIVVEDVFPDFTSAPTYTCMVPQTISFTNTTTSNTTSSISYQWSFSSGHGMFSVNPDNSTATNPTIVLTERDTNQYTVWDEQYLVSVTLVATTSHGCTESITKSFLDTVYLPTARFQPDKYQGCAPLTIAYSDSSKSKETIVSWAYDFGDGTTATQATGDVTHTYTSPGIYYATLVITNSAGCIDTSYAIRIEVGGAPTPDFSISPATACANTPIDFTDLSVPAANSPIDTWHYYTDNDFIMSSCYNDPNPTYSFVSQAGSQDVTLEVCSRGCCSTVTQPNAVTINGPIVEFTSALDCDSSHVVKFTSLVQDASSYTWDFGDGSPQVSNEPIVTHTFTTTGDYTVKLWGTGTCPADTFSMDVYIKDIKADFITDSVFCSGVPGPFNAGPSVDVYSFTKNGYIWLWGDNTPPTITPDSIAVHQYASPGLYTTKLIVTDRNGCRDTITKDILVSKVVADFTVDKFNGCVPGWTPVFMQSAVSDHALTDWDWNFGDGGTGTGDTTTHTYTNATALNFTVTLTVTNEYGCVHDAFKVLTPSVPVATFSSSNLQLCTGTGTDFFPSSQILGYSYEWNFGDGGQDSVAAPTYTVSHTYTAAGNYNVSLTVTDTIGCQRTQTLNNYVSVQEKPQAGFSSPSDALSALCYPHPIVFNDTSIANVFGTREWDLGNGSVIAPNPSAFTIYQTPGVYDVSLIVTTTFGCSDTISKQYNVVGPSGDFTVSDNTICKGETVTFDLINAVDVTSYEWNFGDGTNAGMVDPVQHTYTFHPPSGTTNVTLVLYTGNKVCPVSVIKPINIHQVIADFNRNGVADTDTAHCLGLPDAFTNESTNATTWTWNFGDGSPTTTANDPNHTYATADTFDVSLAIFHSATGCADTMIKQMVIHPKPVAVTGDELACAGQPVTLQASGAGPNGEYQWIPATDLSNDTIFNPVATVTTPTSYDVIVTSQFGCTDTATAQIGVVVEPLPVTWSTSIIIGQTTPLDYPYPQSYYIYSWNPTDSLGCNNCPSTTSDPREDITYTLTITDMEGCFTTQAVFTVDVRPLSTAEMPTAFTPNGDGVNDIVYVRGWGLESIEEFTVYNRWGQVVFTTNDIEQGWDGTMNGVPQNMDTYAYIVKVRPFPEASPSSHPPITGYIKLIR